MVWIIAISAFIVISLVLGLILFSWRNAKASIRPNTISIEREIELNKERGYWQNFDSYNHIKYEIKGRGGYILHAEFVDTPDTQGTGKYVILHHGHTSNRYSMVKYLHSYIKLGFSCLIYDSRTHGETAQDVCTLGYYESEDLNYVIEDTRNRYKDLRILGIHGESMGSSTALNVVRFNPEIDFIVADCGFTSTYDVVKDGYGNVHLQFLVPFIRLAGRIIYRVDLIHTNALKALENNHYPILFIHGAGDTFIKPKHSERLREQAAKNGAYTELILVEGAGHAKSRAVAGFEKYTGYISDFLDNIGIQ